MIVKDNRIGKAILLKMSKEYNFDINNIYLNDWHKYIVTIDIYKKDADFCTTDYKGKTYKVQYFSGCFNPYIVQID